MDPTALHIPLGLLPTVSPPKKKVASSNIACSQEGKVIRDLGGVVHDGKSNEERVNTVAVNIVVEGGTGVCPHIAAAATTSSSSADDDNVFAASAELD